MLVLVLVLVEVPVLLPGERVGIGQDILLAAETHAASVRVVPNTMYKLPAGGTLIDSPGFQEFGLYHLTEGMLERAFVEFKPYLGGCKYYNCRHLAEPQCAVLQAVADGKIAKLRHDLYAQLLHESAQTLY